MFGRLVDMATRTLIIDLSKGTGGEPMYGIVTVQRARATSEGTFEVLPWETKLKLFNGIATITEAVTDGSGPFYDSAYLIRVQNGYCAPRWGFMAALPDGTTPISTGDMPKVNPITGEGIYMDAQEWNALYGTLPDRVTSLETGKANTAHTHAIGDVTGLQPALNAKGNATMRVDTTVGTRVFVSNGVDPEQMVKGDTGWRIVNLEPVAGKHGGGQIRWRRRNDLVELFINNLIPITGTGYLEMFAANEVPLGFRCVAQNRTMQGIGLSNNAVSLQMITVFGSIGWLYTINGGVVNSSRPPSGLQGIITYTTNDLWPTTLPGNPA